ncbi:MULTISPECIES: HalOD1 output domain-containing protein [unclassified Haladaptatus]|uniref:HalOD1 output domain-containing protein n=1 Tax=unclassified Haladaptatus TaxID=2622732 RepID=UPI00209C3E1F|nr:MULTISPECIES: HalOD1 output domain-containing protein [unclassified Haladaptatus]MCO8244787.1 hypothetical protein [Haladaptatus sp. AB643]MCO8255701.1 hypothetical protein [Haladaptatus sp. AB618]
MSNDTPLDHENGEMVTTDTYSTEFDPITDRASEELIRAVATLNDVDPIELPCLANYIDPEALDTLFRPLLDGTSRGTSGKMEFSYDSYHVTVESRGVINLSSHGTETNS